MCRSNPISVRAPQKTTAMTIEIKAIIPVEGGVFSPGFEVEEITVEATLPEDSALEVSVASVTSVTSVSVPVEESEIGKFVSVSVNSSVSVVSD